MGYGVEMLPSLYVIRLQKFLSKIQRKGLCHYQHPINGLKNQPLLLISYKIQVLLSSTFPEMEDMIADSMSAVMERSEILSIKDQKAIGQELREWLNEGVCIDELLTMPFLR